MAALCHRAAPLRTARILFSLWYLMRQADITRNTLETQITVSINLDGEGRSHFATGVPFLEHMLDQICRHGLIDLDISAVGDLSAASGQGASADEAIRLMQDIAREMRESK